MKRSMPAISLTALVCISSVLVWAQAPQPYPPQGAPQTYPQGTPPAPTYSPQELDQLVAPYALYPDPLLAQVLTASTFSNEIPDADGWARSHAYLTGDALARAMQEDNLPWDPSVIALLPTPSVLDIMAGDMGRTEELGNAVLANRALVMDSIQDQRQKAYNYGYLRSNPQYRVLTPGPGDIEILPVGAGILHWRRDRLRARHFDRRVLSVGLGRGQLWLESAHHTHRRPSVGEKLGESRKLCSSVRGSGTSASCQSRAAHGTA